MKKHLYGILFAAAICAAAAGTYFLVMHTQADYPVKLIFSGILLLLALIAGAVAASKTKDDKARAVAKALYGTEICGIGVYADGEFVYANRFYTEAEQKADVNIYKLLKENKPLEGYTVREEKHGEYTLIFVNRAVNDEMTTVIAESGEKSESITEDENGKDDNTEISE